MYKQKEVFLKHEGDKYFERNEDSNPLITSHQDYLFLKRFIKPDSSFLEIGCADGKNVKTFTEPLNVKYTGIDPSIMAVKKAKELFPESIFIQGTADELPFESKTFDFVYLGFFLYLVDRELLTKVVYEVDRCLKSGGLLAITDFSPAFPYVAEYRHHKDVLTYKYNYELLFEALPHFKTLEKKIHYKNELSQNENDWIATTLLYKDYDLCKKHIIKA